MAEKKQLEKSLSVQPFWEAEKINKKLLVNEKTGSPIAVAYEIKADPGAEALTSVPGIGLIGILFSLDPEHPGAVCAGTLNKSKKVPLLGMQHYLNCHFMPGEFTRIFGIPSQELTDREIPLQDLIRAGSTAEEIACCQTFEERIELILRFIHNWESRTRTRDANGVAQYIMHESLAKKGNLKISDLEQETGYSARYIQKIMLEQVGFAPKTALANIRFQNALRTMLENPFMPITQIAQQAGYYDQSHFNKIFKENAGITPIAFQKRLQEILRAGEDIKM